MYLDQSVKSVNMIIKGRVQGVSFRAWTEAEAKKLNISGWVKNLDNGDVEIVAEGNETNLHKFINLCKHGPGAARVENIQIKWEKFSGEFSDFEVVYY